MTGGHETGTREPSGVLMRTGQMSAGVHRSASLVTRPHPHQPSSPNSLHCRESLLKLLLLHPPTLPADKNTLTLFFTFTCSLQPILKRVFIIMNESQGNTSIFNLRGKFLLGTFSAACSHRSSDFLLAPAPEAGANEADHPS